MIGSDSSHTPLGPHGLAVSARRGTARARLAACLSVLCLAGLVVSASARAEERGHEFTGSFGKGIVTEPEGVAVNEASGNVYVVDRAENTVDVFNAKHELSGEINGSGLLAPEGKAAGSGSETWEEKTGRFSEPTEVAVDNGCRLRKLSGSACAAADSSNGDVYIVDRNHSVIDKYTAAGEYVGQITGTVKGGAFANGLHGVAVAPDGSVRVSAYTYNPLLLTFSNAAQNGCNACLLGESEPFEHTGLAVIGETGLAVDASDDVYAAGYCCSPIISYVFEDTDTDAFLGQIPEKAGGLAVEESDSDLYLAAAGQVTRYGPSRELIETLKLAGLNPGGAAVDDATGEVLVSDRSTDAVDVFGLEGPKVPSIRDTGAQGVATSSALFVSEINPRGAAATYQVEYGACRAESCSTSGFESVAPAIPGSVGDTFESMRVHVAVEHLAPGTEYHLRVTAANAIGSHAGEEVVFTTRRAGVSGLLDGRIWEQVSPSAKEGALIWPIGENGVAEAAASGDAVTYSASNPTEPSPEGYTNDVQVISAREAGGGWGTRDLALPHDSPTGKSTALGDEYRLFSEDLERAVVQPFGSFVPLSEAASEQTAYIHDDFAPSPPVLCTEDCYRPLVTGCPEAGVPCSKAVTEDADVPAGTAFALTGETCSKAKICGPLVRAASEDLSAVLLEAGVPLTEGSGAGLYEWTAGRLHYVGGKLPNGPAEAFATVSNGGSRVVVGSTRGAHPLRMVDPLNGEEAQLDEGTACAGCQSGGGERAWVSDAAKTVFFRDKRRLTASSGAGLGDLYVCETPAFEVGCYLTDLTPKVSGEEAEVLGIVGASRDGRSVYFVANGRLGTSAPRGSCEEGTAVEVGECNLFVIQRNESGWEAPTLIGVLSGGDRTDWSTALTQHTASMSENGDWLVFMSDAALTGYDNSDATSGEPDEEVYAYHREPGMSGVLRCVSCNPTDERPHGVEYGSLEERLAGGPRLYPSGRWIAGSIPGWTPFELEESAHDARLVSDSGRVFFNSSDRLSVGDDNESEDVYEWEPAGVGSCSGEATAFSGASGGCVALVSSGRSGEESGFVDASASGDDVFFLTFAQVSEGKGGSSLDLYDAHVCSAAAPCSPSAAGETAECADSATCQGAVLPASAAFGGLPTELVPAGVGNLSPVVAGVTPTAAKPLTKAQRLALALRACRQHRRKSTRQACERGARQRYGKKSSARRGKASRRTAPARGANRGGGR
jgi:DNA-binding beta-propeller fold protein YncE